MKDRPSLYSSLQNGVRHARRMLLSGLLVLLGVLCAPAQTALIKGTVVDDTGEPLIGASVSSLGKTKAAVVTDIDGNFTIRVTPGEKLSFSYVGYETKEEPAKDGMNVVLTSSSVALQGVEVVAYGVQKKVTVTGAISSVKGDELVKTPVSSVNNVLAGQLSGVTTVQYSGVPGSIRARPGHMEQLGPPYPGRRCRAFDERYRPRGNRVDYRPQGCLGNRSIRCAWCQRRSAHYNQAWRGR